MIKCCCDWCFEILKAFRDICVPELFLEGKFFHTFFLTKPKIDLEGAKSTKTSSIQKLQVYTKTSSIYKNY